MPYTIEHTEHPGLFLHRLTRTEAGRFGWRAWLLTRWTDDPTQAKVWTTEKGVDAYVRRYPTHPFQKIALQQGAPS